MPKTIWPSTRAPQIEKAKNQIKRFSLFLSLKWSFFHVLQDSNNASQRTSIPPSLRASSSEAMLVCQRKTTFYSMSLDPARARKEAPWSQPVPPHPCQEMMSQRHSARVMLVRCLKRKMYSPELHVPNGIVMSLETN